MSRIGIREFFKTDKHVVQRHLGGQVFVLEMKPAIIQAVFERAGVMSRPRLRIVVQLGNAAQQITDDMLGQNEQRPVSMISPLDLPDTVPDPRIEDDLEADP